ncbi:hypothetical protein D3C76_1385120 [compost metagenome]
MIYGVPPADGQEVVLVPGVNFKAFGQAGGAKLYRFSAISVWKADPIKYMPLYEQGCPLNQGDILIGLMSVTEQQ